MRLCRPRVSEREQEGSFPAYDRTRSERRTADWKEWETGDSNSHGLWATESFQFDPVRTADNLRRQGGFIPGIRPRRPTADYLNDILVRITLRSSHTSRRRPRIPRRQSSQCRSRLHSDS